MIGLCFMDIYIVVIGLCVVYIVVIGLCVIYGYIVVIGLCVIWIVVIGLSSDSVVMCYSMDIL